MVSFADLTSACPELAKLLADARGLRCKDGYCRTWAVVERAITALVRDGIRQRDPILSSRGALAEALVVIKSELPFCPHGCSCRRRAA
jgi:hypothetical protein